MSHFMFDTMATVCLVYRFSMSDLPKDLMDEAKIMDHRMSGCEFAEWINHRIFAHVMRIRCEEQAYLEDKEDLCFVATDDLDYVIMEMEDKANEADDEEEDDEEEEEEEEEEEADRNK